MMTTSKPVRVSVNAHQAAASIAGQSGLSMTEVFDKAIDALEREMFFQKMNEAYERLVADEKLDEFKREMAAWDVTLSDGLE